MNHFEQTFHCRILQWAEPTGDQGEVQFTVIDRNKRVVVADTLELLALELSEPVPTYQMAA